MKLLIKDGNMVYCSNCGEKNKDGNKFCSNCGEPMGSSPRSDSSKPIKSRVKSQNQYSKSPAYIERPSQRKKIEETAEIPFEWNVVIVGGIIFVIMSGILSMFLPVLSVIIAAAIAIIYVLSATRKKVNIVFIIPLTFVMAAAFFALFSL